MFHTAKVFQVAQLVPVESTAPLLTGNEKKIGNKATRAPDQYPIPAGLPHPPPAVGRYAKCNACPSTVSPCYTYVFDVLASFACQVYS